MEIPIAGVSIQRGPFLERSAMRLLPALLLLLIAPCSVFGLTSVTVQYKMMATSGDTSSCVVPTPVTTFLTSDPAAYVWFEVNGANAGDVPAVKWYSPGGSLYATSSWVPVASAGSWCYAGWIYIAGHGAASLPGNWTVEVDWNGVSLFTLPFSIAVLGSVPQILAGGVVNGASFAPAPSPVAQGSIAAIFGSNLASGTGSATALPLPTSMYGAKVSINGIQAPLFFVSPGQINAQIPWEVGNASQLSVQVTVNGLASNTLAVDAANVAPGCFTINQAGQGAILIAGTERQHTRAHFAAGRARRLPVVVLHGFGRCDESTGKRRRGPHLLSFDDSAHSNRDDRGRTGWRAFLGVGARLGRPQPDQRPGTRRCACGGCRACGDLHRGQDFEHGYGSS